MEPIFLTSPISSGEKMNSSPKNSNNNLVSEKVNQCVNPLFSTNCEESLKKNLFKIAK